MKDVFWSDFDFVCVLSCFSFVPLDVFLWSLSAMDGVPFMISDKFACASNDVSTPGWMMHCIFKSWLNTHFIFKPNTLPSYLWCKWWQRHVCLGLLLTLYTWRGHISKWIGIKRNRMNMLTVCLFLWQVKSFLTDLLFLFICLILPFFVCLAVTAGGPDGHQHQIPGRDREGGECVLRRDGPQGLFFKSKVTSQNCWCTESSTGILLPPFLYMTLWDTHLTHTQLRPLYR